MSLARQVGDRWVMSMALEALALAALARGELAVARSLAQASLSLEAEPPRCLKERALRTLINVGIAEGCTTAARRDALALLVLAVDSRSVGVAGAGIVETLAGVAAGFGQPDVALRLVGAAEAAWETASASNLPVYCDLRDRWLLPLRKTVRAEDADRWWAEGRALSLDDAVVLARGELSDTPSPAPAAPSVAGLTSREVEVLRLVAKGWTNKEIAAELVLSVRTVERHLANLYAKIDARSKADATA